MSKYDLIEVYQINPFKEEQGGGIRYISNLLSSFKNSVNEIFVFGIGPKEVSIDNIKLIPITKKRTGYIRFLLNLSIKLSRSKISKNSIIHVHRLYFAIPFIILKPKLKIVCTLHGRTFSVFESRFGTIPSNIAKPFFMLIEKFCIRHIDYLVPVSYDVYNQFDKKYKNFGMRPLSVIGSMLDLECFKIIESNFLQKKFGFDYVYVLFIGRLSDVKDLNFLINLWSKKFCNDKQFKLIIAGDGECKDYLIKLSEMQCKSNPPIFIGTIEPTKIPELISSASICVLCSKHEASPTVVKESLACGIPIITNNIGDVDLFIKNEINGLIVNKDFDSYFNAICYFTLNKKTKKEVLSSSINELYKCSTNYITDQYLDVFKSL